MKAAMSTSLVAPLLIFFTISLVVSGSALSIDYYAETCPDAELAVTEVVKEAIANDDTVPAALLRLHFHDCFIRVPSPFSLAQCDWVELKGVKPSFLLSQGCDASVLLKSRGRDKAEKDGPPNESLHAFYVIDHAKKAVEKMCPGVVSCADILALAARDSVALVSQLKPTVWSPCSCSIVHSMHNTLCFNWSVVRWTNVGGSKGKKRWKGFQSQRNKSAPSSDLQLHTAEAELLTERTLHQRLSSALR